MTRLRHSQRQRLWGVVGLALAAVLFAAWRRTMLWPYALIAAGVVIGAYHGLYRLSDQPYSFSRWQEPVSFLIEVGVQVGLALLLGLMVYLFLLALRQAADMHQVLVSSYEWLFFTLIGFWATVFYGYWQVGLVVNWHFPDMAILFLYLSALVQVASAGILGLLMPFIVVSANILIQRRLANYQRRKIGKLQTESV